MKLFKGSIFMLIAFLALELTSCSKTSSPTPTQTYTLTLTFNGTDMTFNNATAVYNTSEAFFELAAQNSSGTFEIVIPTGFTTGTFSLSTGGAASIVYTTKTDEYAASTGTLVISSIASNTVSGTFSFTGLDSSNKACTGTNGVFTASYSTTSAL